MQAVCLGSETDDELFDRLCRVVADLGGSIGDSEWVLGGSQEITTYTIVLPAGTLEALAETYIGLSLRGDKRLVELVSQQMVLGPTDKSYALGS